MGISLPLWQTCWYHHGGWHQGWRCVFVQFTIAPESLKYRGLASLWGHAHGGFKVPTKGRIWFLLQWVLEQQHQQWNHAGQISSVVPGIFIAGPAFSSLKSLLLFLSCVTGYICLKCEISVVHSQEKLAMILLSHFLLLQKHLRYVKPALFPTSPSVCELSQLKQWDLSPSFLLQWQKIALSKGYLCPDIFAYLCFCPKYTATLRISKLVAGEPRSLEYNSSVNWSTPLKFYQLHLSPL